MCVHGHPVAHRGTARAKSLTTAMPWAWVCAMCGVQGAATACASGPSGAATGTLGARRAAPARRTARSRDRRAPPGPQTLFAQGVCVVQMCTRVRGCARNTLRGRAVRVVRCAKCPPPTPCLCPHPPPPPIRTLIPLYCLQRCRRLQRARHVLGRRRCVPLLRGLHRRRVCAVPGRVHAVRGRVCPPAHHPGLLRRRRPERAGGAV
jgi:hypothetical protein